MQSLVPELAVSSIAASLRFYCDIIGFSVLYDRPEEGFAYLHLGQAELMLDQLGMGRDWVTAPLVAPLGRGVNFQIAVEGLDAILDRLATVSLPLFVPVETKTYGTASDAITQRQFCVQDPDGYLLRLFERQA